MVHNPDSHVHWAHTRSISFPRLSEYADDNTQPKPNFNISKNLKINSSKTREIVVVKRNYSIFNLQSPTNLNSNPGVPRSTSIKVLGVANGEKLTVSENINQVIQSGTYSIFELETLKNP